MISTLHVSEGADWEQSGFNAWERNGGIELRIWGAGHEIVRQLSADEAMEMAERIIRICKRMEARRHPVPLIPPKAGVDPGVALRKWSERDDKSSG